MEAITHIYDLHYASVETLIPSSTTSGGSPIPFLYFDHYTTLSFFIYIHTREHSVTSNLHALSWPYTVKKNSCFIIGLCVHYEWGFFKKNLTFDIK